MIIGMALAMFVALIVWGGNYFGWDDPSSKVRLALFASFIFGALIGYRSKD
ncbi:MAG TPA: hypothetical protein VFP53_06905 [Sphingomicrobium sp.]|nr:hypothetical protein [Sphingomicrobium sp.]